MAAMITTIHFYVYVSKNVELEFQASNTATKRNICQYHWPMTQPQFLCVYCLTIHTLM